MALIIALAIEVILQNFLALKAIDNYFIKISKKPKTQLIIIPLIFFMSIISGSLLFVNSPRTVTPKYSIYKIAANWLNGYAFSGASVATNEIGIIGFYYNREKVIDALGLITPEVAEKVSQKDYGWYIRYLQPDMLLFSYPNRQELEKMVHEGWFQKKYQRAKILRHSDLAVAIYIKLKAMKLIDKMEN